MDNKEAIKLLKTILRTVCLGNRKFINAVKKAISALEKQEADRWVPVTERLPEEDKDVLVTVHFLGVKDTHHGWNDHIKPTFYVDIAKHYSGEWSSDSDEYKVARSRHIVTAWRPLPEPYTEKKYENYIQEFMSDDY